MSVNVVHVIIGCSTIVENYGKDIKGGFLQITDYESVWSPENSSTRTTSELPADYENTNVDQMVATNYGNLPPQNSSTYESVRLPDSSHIYDALSKDGIYK